MAVAVPIPRVASAVHNGVQVRDEQCDSPQFCGPAMIDPRAGRAPDATTLMRLKRLLEAQ